MINYDSIQILCRKELIQYQAIIRLSATDHSRCCLCKDVYLFSLTYANSGAQTPSRFLKWRFSLPSIKHPKTTERTPIRFRQIWQDNDGSRTWKLASLENICAQGCVTARGTMTMWGVIQAEDLAVWMVSMFALLRNVSRCRYQISLTKTDPSHEFSYYSRWIDTYSAVDVNYSQLTTKCWHWTL